MKLKFIFLLFICNSHYSQVEKIKIEKDDSTIFTFVDEYPEFPGGTSAMFQFIKKNLNFSNINCDSFGCKPFWIKFTVDSTGEAKNVSIITNTRDCPTCEIEIERIFKMMPKWKPGYVNGKAVNTYYNLPIRIKFY